MKSSQYHKLVYRSFGDSSCQVRYYMQDYSEMNSSRILFSNTFTYMLGIG